MSDIFPADRLLVLCASEVKVFKGAIYACALVLHDAQQHSPSEPMYEAHRTLRNMERRVNKDPDVHEALAAGYTDRRATGRFATKGHGETLIPPTFHNSPTTLQQSILHPRAWPHTGWGWVGGWGRPITLVRSGTGVNARSGVSGWMGRKDTLKKDWVAYHPASTTTYNRVVMLSAIRLSPALCPVRLLSSALTGDVGLCCLLLDG